MVWEVSFRLRGMRGGVDPMTSRSHRIKNMRAMVPLYWEVARKFPPHELFYAKGKRGGACAGASFPTGFVFVSRKQQERKMALAELLAMLRRGLW